MECIKLAAYFDERQRVEDGFLADELMHLYARRGIASSTVLRGIAGFGPRRHLRSDRSLTLSENPPVVVVAVDIKTAIEGLLDPLAVMHKRALMTLERARLITGEESVPSPGGRKDEATKLTVYLGRKERINRAPGYQQVCDLLYRRGFDGASAFLGVDGTVHGDRRRAQFFGSNADVPVMVVAIGDAERVDATLPELCDMVHRPLITVERVRVCKRDGVLLQRPHQVPGTDERGLALWQKLMIYTSESDLYEGQPVHRVLVHRLLDRKSISGATVLRAVWGFHGGGRPHGDRLLRLTRRVPVVTAIADKPENIAESFGVIDEITAEHGLVTSEVVPALIGVDGQHRRGGPNLAEYRN